MADLKTLVGSRFRLIPFQEEHISDTYIGWLNNPEVNRFLEVRHIHQTYETVLAFVRSFYGDTEKYMWSVYAKDINESIGTATLYNINRYHGSGEIGLMIGEKDYWGKGASDEAMELIARFAFQTLGLRRLTGGSYATNYGMNFTFKRSGFTLEGKLRQACLVSPGNYVDGYRWGLLVEEWQARTQPAARERR
ncbi:GNAT family N-acetyltransferase [Chloroflexota bacterium]